MAGSLVAGAAVVSAGALGRQSRHASASASPTRPHPGALAASALPPRAVVPGLAADSGKATPPGGTLRVTAPSPAWDTFDVDRSRFTPVAQLYGLTNLGVVQWHSYKDNVLEGGFASSWEMPDPLTIVFTVREGQYWHDKPPVDSRPANANDIAAFILRNRDRKLNDGTQVPEFWRSASYQKVSSVQAMNEGTVKVQFTMPDPFFINTLAGPFAKVMAPEAIDAFEADFSSLNPAHVIGTGPFVLNEFSQDLPTRFTRHPAAAQPPAFAGVSWLPVFSFDQVGQQEAFEQKDLDYFAPADVAVADDMLQRHAGKVSLTKSFQSNAQVGTYAAQGEPWSDARRVGAIFKALDRRAYISSLLDGAAALSGSVPPLQAAFALNEQELITFEGYREDRATEETEAKAMWDAAGGPGLGEIVVDFPDIWQGLYGGAAAVAGQLKAVLGNDFTPTIQTYATISNKVTNTQYGNGHNNIWYGWIFDIVEPEPTLSLYGFFNSAQPQFSQFGVKVDKIDELTSQAITELNVETRRDLVKETQRELLRHWGAGLPYTCTTNNLAWNYLKVREFTAFVTSHEVAGGWHFDMSDPTWQGRPG